MPLNRKQLIGMTAMKNHVTRILSWDSQLENGNLGIQSDFVRIQKAEKP